MPIVGKQGDKYIVDYGHGPNAIHESMVPPEARAAWEAQHGGADVAPAPGTTSPPPVPERDDARATAVNAIPIVGPIATTLDDVARHGGIVPFAKKGLEALANTPQAQAVGEIVGTAAHALAPNVFDAPAQPPRPTRPEVAPPPSPGPSATPQGMVPQLAMGAGGAGMEGRSLSVQRPAGVAATGSYGDEKKALDAATKKQLAAEDAKATAFETTANAVAAVEEGRLRAMEEAEQRRLALEARAAQIRDEKLKAVESAQQELNSLQTQIDPNRFWKDKGTGDRLAAAVGVFLGGLGGGPNEALGILDRAIARDIDAQKASFQNAKELGVAKVAAANNLFALHMQALDDERAAELATRDAMLSMFDTRLQVAKARTASAEVKANADAAKALIETERAKIGVELQGRINSEAIQRAGLELQQQENAIRLQAARNEAAGNNRELFVPGVGFALDKEAAKKARELTGNYNSVAQDMQRLIEFREKYGAETLDRAAMAEVQTLAQRVQLGLKADGALGAMDKGSQEFLDRMVGDPTSVGFVLPKLQALKSSVDNSYRARVAPYLDPTQSQLPVRARKG